MQQWPYSPDKESQCSVTAVRQNFAHEKIKLHRLVHVQTSRGLMTPNLLAGIESAVCLRSPGLPNTTREERFAVLFGGFNYTINKSLLIIADNNNS